MGDLRGFVYLVGFDADLDGVVDHPLYGYHYLHFSGLDFGFGLLCHGGERWWWVWERRLVVVYCYKNATQTTINTNLSHTCGLHT